MGEIVVYIAIFLLLFRFAKRSTRFVMLGAIGLSALGAGLYLLSNAGSFINIGAALELNQVKDVLEVIGIIVAVIVVASIVLGGSIRGFVSQKRFEWRVDRFFDAWHSRNDRWL